MGVSISCLLWELRKQVVAPTKDGGNKYWREKGFGDIVVRSNEQLQVKERSRKNSRVIKVTGSHTAIYWQRQILQFPAPRFLQLFRC